MVSTLKKNFFHLFSGETASFISSFLASYFYAFFLGPELFGTWQTARVFISYSIIFSLSLPFVLRRDFVMLKAEGRNEEAEKLSNLVYTYQIVTSILFAIGLVLYAEIKITDKIFRYTMFTVAGIYVLQTVGGFLNILNKGLNNYKLIRNNALIIAILTVLSIIAVYFWGYLAVLFSSLIIALITSVLYFVKRPFKLCLFWDNKLFKSMFLVAFPLYLQDISAIIFESVDRLIIAKFLNFKEVGFYSLSSFIASPVRLLLSSFSLVLFTQLNSQYGFKKDKNVINYHTIIPHQLFSFSLPVIIGIAVLITPVCVEIFLPKYTEGIGAAQIAIFGIYYYLLAGFCVNGLFVLNKQKVSAIIFFITGIIKVALSICFLGYDLGISGVAVATLISYLLLDIILLIVVYRYYDQSKVKLLKYLFKQIYPSLFVGGFCLVYFRFIDNILLTIFGLYRIPLCIIIYIILFIPVIIYSIRSFRHLLVYSK